MLVLFTSCHKHLGMLNPTKSHWGWHCVQVPELLQLPAHDKRWIQASRQEQHKKALRQNKSQRWAKAVCIFISSEHFRTHYACKLFPFLKICSENCLCKAVWLPQTQWTWTGAGPLQPCRGMASQSRCGESGMALPCSASGQILYPGIKKAEVRIVLKAEVTNLYGTTFFIF